MINNKMSNFFEFHLDFGKDMQRVHWKNHKNINYKEDEKKIK